MKKTTKLRLLGAAVLLVMIYFIGVYHVTAPWVAVVVFGFAAAYEMLIVSRAEKLSTNVSPSGSRRALILTAGVAISAAAAAILLSFFGNPFVGEPKSETDCIARSGNAKTDAAAKAIISSCRERFSVTEQQCRGDAIALKSEVPLVPNEKMAIARRKLPELAGRSDVEAVRFLHYGFYPDVDMRELGLSLGVRMPVSYRETCQKYFGAFYK